MTCLDIWWATSGPRVLWHRGCLRAVVDRIRSGSLDEKGMRSYQAEPPTLFE